MVTIAGLIMVSVLHCHQHKSKSQSSFGIEIALKPQLGSLTTSKRKSHSQKPAIVI